MKPVTMSASVSTVTGAKPMLNANEDSIVNQSTKMQNISIKEWLREIRIQKLERNIFNEQIK
jgi:hypothetical protein